MLLSDDYLVLFLLCKRIYVKVMFHDIHVVICVLSCLIIIVLRRRELVG